MVVTAASFLPCFIEAYNCPLQAPGIGIAASIIGDLQAVICPFSSLDRSDQKHRSRGIFFTQDWVSLPGVLPVASGADRLDQKGTSRQRLHVAKGHELPTVVTYQRMQVTKRYEIPRVASIKGYEDQRVPMTKGCIMIPRMQCIVIKDLRSCRDPRGVGTNLINECIGWYEQIMYVVWVKSQGRSGQMTTHQFQVIQKDFGLCMSQEMPDVYPYPFKDFSKVTYACGDAVKQEQFELMEDR
ncbi:hypothetical protein F2Q68_00040149 [Brassica cretica]|uniref:Uncharacterized protein n=1 Tax=Brassica cretica TaxID=69181 RepID=A0A8S9MAQ2_BRACR|nr:hypothetical protein F2Q68_00040149 [Brassica cretica]